MIFLVDLGSKVSFCGTVNSNNFELFVVFAPRVLDPKFPCLNPRCFNVGFCSKKLPGSNLGAPRFEKILWWKTSVFPLKRKVGNTPPSDLSNFCWDLLLWVLVWLAKNDNNRSDEFCCTLCQLADITVFLVGFSFYRGVRGVPPLDKEKTICEFPSQPSDTHSIAPLLIVRMTKECGGL